MSITTNPTPRLDLPRHNRDAYVAMQRVERAIELDPRIKDLVKIRASQLNGCAFCLDMHHTHARQRGESEIRLAQIAGWRDSPYFDARERAALALTDTITRQSVEHLSDVLWAEAAAVLDEGELANLLLAIAAINFWNRIAVPARTTPASHEAVAASAA